jgi:hypothetical protein
VSEIEAIEDSIRRSLTTITTHWDALLIPASSGGGSGSKSAQITADDHADTSHDIDWATRVVSMRRFATDVLNGWSRVVMEDRPVTRALPDGSNVPGMAAFLDRHAEWLSWNDAATDCMDEISTLARSAVQPRGRRVRAGSARETTGGRSRYLTSRLLTSNL